MVLYRQLQHMPSNQPDKEYTEEGAYEGGLAVLLGDTIS